MNLMRGLFIWGKVAGMICMRLMSGKRKTCFVNGDTKNSNYRIGEGFICNCHIQMN